MRPRLEPLEARDCPSTSASPVTLDVTTQGGWKQDAAGAQTYGRLGYYIPGVGQSLPAAISGFRLEGIDTRSPAGGVLLNLDDVPSNVQRPTDPTQRVASWQQQDRYVYDGEAIYFSLADATPVKVSVYLNDPYPNGHGERVAVRDADTDALLAPEITVGDLAGGKYAVVTLSGAGNYEIELAQTITVGGFGALFWDPAGAVVPPTPIPTPTPSVSFVMTDAMTQGGWEGVYGGDGSATPTTAPASPRVAVRGASSWTWAASTDDARALQSPVGRTASAWYSNTNFDVTVSGAGRVALYFVDYDGRGRGERVDVIDANNRVLDTRFLSDFGGGTWLVWQKADAAPVTFHVTHSGGDNAVLSGVFLG